MPNKHIDKYTNVAVILHWIMAIAFMLMLASGFALEYLEISKPLKFNMYQWHKSLGVLILITAFIRIGWRLFNKPPVYPNELKKRDVILSKIGNIALYILMITLPISGWVIVSSSSSGIPTIVFDMFQWPHIPDIQGNKSLHHDAEEAHEIMAFIFLSFIGLHIIGVIKHKITDKINLLPRMCLKKRK